MPFKVTVDGESMLTEDLTLDELGEVEKETGESWDVVITAPLKNAAMGRAIVAKILTRRYGPEQAVKRAGAMTFREVIDAFDLVESDRPKKHDAAGMPEADPKAATADPATS